MPTKKRGASAAAAAQQWKIGDLVLAKVKGFPAWPAQVSRAEDYGRQRNAARVFVVFFGTQQIRFCHSSEISAFTQEARAALHSRIVSKCVPSDLRRAVKEICDVADVGKLKDGWTGVTKADGNIDGNKILKKVEEDGNVEAGITQSLESRRSNGLQRLSKKKCCRIEESDDCSNVPSNVHREWESSCTNSCSSPVEEPSSRVVTNCAELELEQTEKTDDKRRPEVFTWTRQSSRTGRRLLRKQDRVVAKPFGQDASHAEGFGESRNITKKQRTACLKRHLDNSSTQVKDNGVDKDPDRHLPLLKRARSRVMHEGPRSEKMDSIGQRQLDGNTDRDCTSGADGRSEMMKRCHHAMPVGRNDNAPETSNQQQKLQSTKRKGTGILRNGKAFVDREVLRRVSILNEKRICGKLRVPAESKEVKGMDGRLRRDEPCLSHKAGDEEDSDVDESTVLKKKLAEYYKSSKTVEDLDDLPFLSTTPKFHLEEGVNKVRQAYEAAKEKKQKLASKNATGPSTSMKFLLAAAQTKQLHSAAFHKTTDAQREAALSAEVEAAQLVLEKLLSNLSRARDSIGRVTRQAVNCAKLGASEQVIDTIATKMEAEQRFHRRIDLFLLVDSIVQWSHNQRGTPAGVYRSLVQNTLPRLLSAAAPPGNFARENRRHCLGVLKLWLERNIFPATVVRHFMREVEYHDSDKSESNANQRLMRTDRPLDDPIREMDGMQVDEYGSNAGFPLPGLVMHRMVDDEDSGGGRTSENLVLEPASFGGVQRHPHILEQVDGELEMEDVSPVPEPVQLEQQKIQLYMLPPLPTSPPPTTPPPPPEYY